MTMIDSQELTKVITHRYKNLEDPDYYFVSQLVLSKPYQSLIDKLEDTFEIQEITDENDDFSFRYVLTKAGSQWVLELSMVGSYAIVFRLSGTGAVEFVTPENSTREEKYIYSLLIDNQFLVLDQKVLELRCPLKLINTEPENVRFYQALFSDTDVLPWNN